MDSKIKFRSLIPHEGISNAFIKSFAALLVKSGFERQFEHMDPGGLDVHLYQSKDGSKIVITLTGSEHHMDALTVSSDWPGLKALFEEGVEEFARQISETVKGTIKIIE